MIFKHILKISRSQFTIFNFGLVLSLLMANFGTNSLVAANFEELESYASVSTTQSRNSGLRNVPIDKQIAKASPGLEAYFVELPAPVSTLTSQRYLYGQSSQPEQIGQDYLVFEVREDKLVGAFYMPRSEFACFYGEVDGQQMNLNVVDPYSQEIFAYGVPLEAQSNIAQGDGQIASSLAPQGYEQINTLSDKDQHILNTCVSAHHSKVWQ